MSVIRRARVMFALRDLIERHLDELSVLVADEHGKVVSDAKGEVIRGMEVVEYACGIPTLLKGEFSEQVSTDVDAYSFRQPLGVCAGITPFNFPAMVPMWMHPIAIADREHLHPQAERARPVRVELHRPAVRRRRAARGRVQRGARGQGGGGRDPGPPRHRGGVVRRLDADRQVRAPAGLRGRQARAGPRRREEPRRGAARRGHGVRRQPHHRGGLRLGRAALHGHLRGGRGGRRGRRPGREAAGRRPRRSRSARAATRPRTWARWSRRRPGTASSATSAAVRRRAPRSSSTAAG